MNGRYSLALLALSWVSALPTASGAEPPQAPENKLVIHAGKGVNEQEKGRLGIRLIRSDRIKPVEAVAATKTELANC